MPQLPSGRNVAIHLNLLNILLTAADRPDNVHQVMGLTTIESLKPYASVIYLVPESECQEEVLEISFRDDALPRPSGYVTIESGYSLDQFDVFSSDWSDEDKQSFQEFISSRGLPLFQSGLKAVDQVRQWLLNEAEPTLRILAHWHVAGIHPCQTEGWAESNPGKTEWDSYDLLATLGYLEGAIRLHPHRERLGLAYDRLQGIWYSICKNFKIPDGWPDLRQTTRENANFGRSEAWLTHFSDSKTNWLHQQCIIECINLWNDYGEGFQKDFPQQYGIIELVVASPEANQYFEQKL
jgi:hypothetical protein